MATTDFDDDVIDLTGCDDITIGNDYVDDYAYYQGVSPIFIDLCEAAECNNYSNGGSTTTDCDSIATTCSSNSKTTSSTIVNTGVSTTTDCDSIATTCSSNSKTTSSTIVNTGVKRKAMSSDITRKRRRGNEINKGSRAKKVSDDKRMPLKKITNKTQGQGQNNNVVKKPSSTKKGADNIRTLSNDKVAELLFKKIKRILVAEADSRALYYKMDQIEGAVKMAVNENWMKNINSTKSGSTKKDSTKKDSTKSSSTKSDSTKKDIASVRNDVKVPEAIKKPPIQSVSVDNVDASIRWLRIKTNSSDYGKWAVKMLRDHMKNNVNTTIGICSASTTTRKTIGSIVGTFAATEHADKFMSNIYLAFTDSEYRGQTVGSNMVIFYEKTLTLKVQALLEKTGVRHASIEIKVIPQEDDRTKAFWLKKCRYHWENDERKILLKVVKVSL